MSDDDSKRQADASVVITEPEFAQMVLDYAAKKAGIFGGHSIEVEQNFTIKMPDPSKLMTVRFYRFPDNVKFLHTKRG